MMTIKSLFLTVSAMSMLLLGTQTQVFAATTDEQAAATAEAGADYFVSLSFKPGDNQLTDTAKADLDALVSKARSTGKKIDGAKVLAWSDSEFYGEKTKLSKSDQELAKKRAEAIKTYLKDSQSISGISTYNMAKPAGKLSQFFETTESKVKNELATARNNSSKALVMIGLKR